MLTYFRSQYGLYPGEPTEYVLGEILTHWITDSTILVSTRHRAWLLLNREEYRALVEHRLQEKPSLFSVCEDLGIIITRRNYPGICDLSRRRFWFLRYPPTQLFLTLTKRCNLSCVYCYAGAEKSNDSSLDMTEDVRTRALDFFLSIPNPAGEFVLNFTGGEPLLRWDLILASMDYCNVECERRGWEARYVIQTNLVAMTDAIAREAKSRGNISFTSSLDGPEHINDYHRRDRQGNGTYRTITAWVNKLRDQYGLDVALLPTFTSRCRGFERQIVEEYLAQGQRSFYYRPVAQIGRAGAGNLGLDPGEFVDSWERVLSTIISINRTGTFFREDLTTRILGNILLPGWSSMCNRRPCGVGVTQVSVDFDGDIDGCDLARASDGMRLGNVLSHTFVQIAEKTESFRSLVPEMFPVCESCAFSPYCTYCLAREHLADCPQLQPTNTDLQCLVYSRILKRLFQIIEADPSSARILTSWVGR